MAPFLVLGATAVSLDPEDWTAWRAQGHRMLDDMFDHLQNLRSGPVWQPIPDAVRAEFQQDLPLGAGDLTAAHERFMSAVRPYSVGNTHPGFMGWVHGGGTVVGMLAEMLAAGLNANLGGRNHMPIEVERQMVRWLAQIVGFPETSSGLFVTGSSMANFLAVLVARTAKLGTVVRQTGLAGQGRLRAYVGKSAHGCIPQALEMAGLGTDCIHWIALDEQQRMDVSAVRVALDQDLAQGYIPFFLCATAGTVDVGAVDPLSELADLAHAHGLWFHVDGAYGALGMMSPVIAPLLRGIEQADSLACDFHKWGQVPYDAGFLLVRDSDAHQRTFASPAAYLRREERGLAAGSPWPCDFGPDLSRGFRALKAWFTLQVYGTDRLGQVMAETCALAQSLKARIQAEKALELMAPVTLNIVCFRYRAGQDSNQVNREIVIRLHESGLVAPSSTVLAGHVVIRAAVVNHRTEQQDMDTLVDAVLRIGAALTEKGQ